MSEICDLGTVLTVWAHPDDEAYLAGGLLAAVREHGGRAVCVTATRGEAADPDATPGERAALGALRTRELADSLTVLGVEEHHWLEHPDGGCATADPDSAAARLGCLLDEVRPDTVVTFGPDGFTGHPDHRAVSAWVDRALASHDARPRLLHAVGQEPAVDPSLDEDFGVFDLGRPRIVEESEVALRLMLSGSDLDRKVEALAVQRSQTSGLLATVGRERFARWVAVEVFAEPPQSR
ncbi:MAG TPA: PIG-L family deacetylase [Nocardioides sp.]|nr:PIG-L family deacetylase [Nocardioides sp.]